MFGVRWFEVTQIHEAHLSYHCDQYDRAVILSKQHSPSIKLLSSSKFNHRMKKKSSQSPEILGALPGLSHFVHSLLCFFLLLRFTLFSRRRFIGLSMTCILQQLPTSLEECTCQLPDSDVIYNIATKTFMVFKRLIRM